MDVTISSAQKFVNSCMTELLQMCCLILSLMCCRAAQVSELHLKKYARVLLQEGISEAFYDFVRMLGFFVLPLIVFILELSL